MKFNYFILFLLVIALVPVSYGQAVLTFSKTSHDFGQVKEGVQATQEFEFTNTGKSPLIISNVSASCGCTTPFWTKDPVLPGKKGKVTASYNSNGRPGMFNKSITVVSNAEPATLVLTIQGSVISKDQMPAPTAAEIASSPVLALNKNSHNFGKLEKGQTAKTTFVVHNTGKSDLQIQRLQSACACVNYTVSKNSIAPGEQATLELTYRPRNLEQQNEAVSLTSNDLKNPVISLTLQAQVVESLSSQSVLKEQKPAVPFKQ
ncbi:DUF1573 domain-containing protein [Rhodocytophaga rosea]|uniref:DUF1573 domain-containing protein n=1 Tax=Rhodocytophaga rosea TaxID=2704465 RepID=A0A6C0GPC5_9BACT|nr:DUF1573 domain-containing protein [Rhodocytophaga rosea]QHT69905.1 DUF1573 domain-containing protein [Rhodocytophaga rosea]